MATERKDEDTKRVEYIRRRDGSVIRRQTTTFADGSSCVEDFQLGSNESIPDGVELIDDDDDNEGILNENGVAANTREAEEQVRQEVDVDGIQHENDAAIGRNEETVFNNRNGDNNGDENAIDGNGSMNEEEPSGEFIPIVQAVSLPMFHAGNERDIDEHSSRQAYQFVSSISGRTGDENDDENGEHAISVDAGGIAVPATPIDDHPTLDEILPTTATTTTSTRIHSTSLALATGLPSPPPPSTQTRASRQYQNADPGLVSNLNEQTNARLVSSDSAGVSNTNHENIPRTAAVDNANDDDDDDDDDDGIEIVEFDGANDDMGDIEVQPTAGTELAQNHPLSNVESENGPNERSTTVAARRNTIICVVIFALIYTILSEQISSGITRLSGG